MPQYAIVGSRSFNDRKLLIQTMKRFKDVEAVVSGGAGGADTLGKKWALKRGIEYIEFLPDWKKFGKSAGFRRNVDIVNESDIVIAFWDLESRGTRSTIELAMQKHKPVFVIPFIPPLPEFPHKVKS